MELLTNLVVLLHLLGMATVVGGWLAVRDQPRIVPAILWGARAQVVTGLLLVGLAEATDDHVDNAKVGVKLLVGLGVVAAAEIANGRQRRDAPKPDLVHVVGVLAVVNTAIAALWR